MFLLDLFQEIFHFLCMLVLLALLKSQVQQPSEESLLTVPFQGGEASTPSYPSTFTGAKLSEQNSQILTPLCKWLEMPRPDIRTASLKDSKWTWMHIIATSTQTPGMLPISVLLGMATCILISAGALGSLVQCRQPRDNRKP